MKLYHIIRRKDYLTGHPENFKVKLDFVSHITNKKNLLWSYKRKLSNDIFTPGFSLLYRGLGSRILNYMLKKNRQIFEFVIKKKIPSAATFS